MTNEIWKDIPNYEGLYQISNLGRIRSLYNYRGKYNILKPKEKRGYYQIGLRKNKKRKWIAIHRLVALTFIPNPNNYKVVNHKNEDKLDNKVENLEWCTTKYNNCYGTRIEKVKTKTSKAVIQYDLNGNFIKEYKSISDASKEVKTSASNIVKCCKEHPKYKKVKNYIWRYKSEVMPNANEKCVLF